MKKSKEIKNNKNIIKISPKDSISVVKPMEFKNFINNYLTPLMKAIGVALNNVGEFTHTQLKFNKIIIQNFERYGDFLNRIMDKVEVLMKFIHAQDEYNQQIKELLEKHNLISTANDEQHSKH